MAEIIIFGTNDTAQLAHYYLQNDSSHEAVAFTVDSQYIPENGEFQGLPVIDFSTVEKHYSPERYQFFAPMTAADMNRARESIYLRAKDKGYRFISYISSKATVLTDNIGENCFILEDNTLQPFTSIGDNVVMWSGNHLGHHSSIDSHSFISSHVVISGHCTIGKYCYLGVNCTLRDGLSIGEGTFIAMGATVTRDTEAWGAYLGSPARSMKKKSTDIKIYHEMD